MKLVLLFVAFFISTTNCEGQNSEIVFDHVIATQGDIDSLIVLISHPDKKIRVKAINTIAISKRINGSLDYTKFFNPVKQQLLAEHDTELQSDFMNVYCAFHESLYKDDDRQLLFEIASDTCKYKVLRWRAFQTLTRLRDDRAIEYSMYLTKQAQSDYELIYHDHILAGAVFYLSTLKYLPAMPEIKKIIDILIIHRTEIEGALSGYFTGFIGSLRDGYGDAAKPYLDSLLHNECDTVRFYAALELSRMEEKYVTPVLIEMLDYSTINIIDGFYSLKVAAIKTIRNHKLYEAIPALKRALNDRTEIGGQLRVAEAAVDALKHFGYKIKETESEPVQYIIEYEPPEYKDLK